MSERRQVPDDSGAARVRRGAKRRRGPGIRVHPDDESLLLDDRERIVRELRRSWLSVLASLSAHVLLFLFAAWIAMRVSRPPAEEIIEAAWLVPTQLPPPEPDPEPVTIGAVTLNAVPRQTRTVDKPQAPPEPQQRPRTIARPADVTTLLDNRQPERREQIQRRADPENRTRKAVEQGLLWLKRQQKSAGNWQLHAGYPDAGSSVIRTDTGATALALLALLGDGNSTVAGEHRDTVERGLRWLAGVQKSDGDFHDHIELGRQTAYYAHAQATMAFCEALALSDDEALREPAESGIRFLLESQHPTLGGWKYQPQYEKSVPDLSVTGWALMALHTGRAAGIDIPDDAFRRASRFLDEVQEQDGSRYKYEPTDPPNRTNAAMTAEGLLCRQFLGWPRTQEQLVDGTDFLMAEQNVPAWDHGRRNVYEWYYVGHVLHNFDDERWRTWYRNVSSMIVDRQTRSGSIRSGRDVRGSWHPTKPTGSPHEYAEKAGRLYVTSMCLLILEMPYRHRPIYQPASEPDAAE